MTHMDVKLSSTYQYTFELDFRRTEIPIFISALATNTFCSEIYSVGNGAHL